MAKYKSTLLRWWVSYQISGSPEDGIIPNARSGYKSTDKEFTVNFTHWDKPNILLAMIWVNSAPLVGAETKLKP